jgi:hypothetical protein
MRQPVGPLDGEYAVLHANFLKPEIVGRRASEPVEIDVVQRQPVTTVLVHQRECWTADRRWIDAEPLRQAAHERGLSGAQIP